MALKRVILRAEGDKVVFGIDNRAHTIPWEQALELARGFYQKAMEAEEYAKANRIIADGALLTRLGVPVGMTNNPKLMNEIGKEAAWNSELRRQFPGGVKALSVVGTPAVKRGPPPQVISPGSVKSTEGFGRLGG